MVISVQEGVEVGLVRLLAAVIIAGGGTLLAAILTGMGRDGAEGARAVAEAGGRFFVQDEATSVVWGMPGAAAAAGVCAAVLPLEQIAPKIVRLFGGDRS